MANEEQRPLDPRFNAKWEYRAPFACWFWKKPLPNGYGRYWNGSEKVPATRHSWESKFGPSPDGMVMDHYICETPSCVNPDHVRPVTQRENVLRGRSSDWQRAKTHCPQRHEYAGENLIIDQGKRRCRTCKTANYLK